MHENNKLKRIWYAYAYENGAISKTIFGCFEQTAADARTTTAAAVIMRINNNNNYYYYHNIKFKS